MRYERTEFERLADNAVLLTLWAESQKEAGGDAVGDKLKLMKLAFLAAYPLYWDKQKALNLQFYRWKRGPMANQVYDSLSQLTERGLLLDEELYIVSDEGMRLSEAFQSEVLRLPENESMLREIQTVASDFARLPTHELLRRVYEMHCYTLDSPGRKHRVSAVSHGTDFTRILDEEEADSSLVIPPGWRITLELTFHPDALRNLRRGIEDVNSGRLYDWEALGASA